MGDKVCLCLRVRARKLSAKLKRSGTTMSLDSSLKACHINKMGQNLSSQGRAHSCKIWKV